MTYQLHHGNCLDIMPLMDRESIDSIVTDPPYGLSFMGKDWDHGVPGEHFWREVYRVAKPGAHLLAFGGTRTFHRLAVAIEDAGWEIRDCVMWVYGQGFPKSHDVSKAIDREAGAEREVIGQHQNGSGTANYKVSIAREFVDITSPATPAAAEWDGWGTALKPAWEPIIVARKPLQGTVAENVQRYGTGAMNIDACRIGHDEPIRQMKAQEHGDLVYRQSGRHESTTELKSNGRWPSNLVHDGSAEVLAGFPMTNAQQTKNSDGRYRADQYAGSGYWGSHSPDNSYADTGSAARFFYCAPHDKLDLLFCRAKAIIGAWTKYDVPIAENDLPLSSQRAVSALSDAVTLVSRGEILLNDLTGLSTTVTPIELKRISEALITAILSLESAPLPDLLQGAVIPNGCLVKFAEIQKQTGITTITISQWKSDGSADVATFSTMQALKDHGEAASANRFVYCAKASKQDRDEGLEGLEYRKIIAHDNPSRMVGSSSDKSKIEGMDSSGVAPHANHHPTVKPTSLMRYLCRLVTPPNGVILDPFMGSGSTGKAAILEGFNFIGVDTEIEYVEISARRIEHACEKVGIVIDQPMLFDTQRATVDKPKQLMLL